MKHEKFVLYVSYKNIGVAGSHFNAHSYNNNLFVIVAGEKQFSVKTSSAGRSSVSELGSVTVR